MKYDVIKHAGGWVLVAAALCFGAKAQASSPDGSNKSTASKAKKKASGQIKFLPGSAETTKERTSRLKRECKGRVNAGACAGYTN